MFPDYHIITDTSTCSRVVSVSKLEIFMRNLRKSFMSMFSIDILKNKQLFLFYLISFFVSCSVVVVWTFSYSHSQDLEIEAAKASMLVAVVGAGSCVGKCYSIIDTWDLCTYGFGEKLLGNHETSVPMALEWNCRYAGNCS